MATLEELKGKLANARQMRANWHKAIAGKTMAEIDPTAKENFVFWMVEVDKLKRRIMEIDPQHFQKEAKESQRLAQESARNAKDAAAKSHKTLAGAEGVPDPIKELRDRLKRTNRPK